MAGGGGISRIDEFRIAFERRLKTNIETMLERSLGAGKIFHAATFGGARAFEGRNDPTAWDAFYPSLRRQLPDEIRPPTRPANDNPFGNAFDWSAVVAEDSAIGDGQVVSWVQRQLAGETESPRFIAAGIYRPHLPWYVPQKYFDMHPLEGIQLPATIENDLDDIPEAGSAGSSLIKPAAGI